MRFEIGDQIWIAAFEQMAATYVVCPDCGGTGRLRVTFHDETQVSIECRNCAAGYDPPTGRIKVYQQNSTARLAIITGVEIRGAETRWHVDATSNSYCIIDDKDAFVHEADALASAQKQAAEYEQEQRDRIFKKEKDTRTWAWNASYHRRGLKEAERNIKHHTAKLAVAVVKSKEDKAPVKIA
jgi:ribosomal protein S27E